MAFSCAPMEGWDSESEGRRQHWKCEQLILALWKGVRQRPVRDLTAAVQRPLNPGRFLEK